MGKLKIYQGSTNGRNRLCVAAPSWVAAHLAVSKFPAKISLSYMRGYWSISGNLEQAEAAMSEPGTVFVSEGDHKPYVAWRPE